MIINGNIPLNTSNFIEETLSTPKISFQWIEDLVGVPNNYQPAGVCILYDEEYNINNLVFESIKPIILDIINSHSLPFKKFLRVRYIKQPDVKIPINYKHDKFHRDLNQKNFSLVYYINNSGGGTVIDTPDIKYEVKHIKGNYVIFDGYSLDHAGVLSQNNTTRSLLNINFI